MPWSLAPFRGTGDLRPEFLVRSGLALGLAHLELDAEALLVDLDEPGVLAAEALRPSIVATGRRTVSQAYAVELFERHPDAAGLRWWSSLEASWLNVTLFDRSLSTVTVQDVHALVVDDDVVVSAAAFLGLA